MAPDASSLNYTRPQRAPSPQRRAQRCGNLHAGWCGQAHGIDAQAYLRFVLDRWRPCQGCCDVLTSDRQARGDSVPLNASALNGGSPAWDFLIDQR